ADTYETISLPSAEPSASTITMMSPVHAWNPVFRASPLPFPRCSTTFTPGHSPRPTSTVSSAELPATSLTSCIQSGSVLKTYGRFSASFRAGITTLTGGAIARCEETGRYLPAGGGVWSAVAGGRTELMSLVPLVRWTARPSGGPALLPVRKGGFHTRPGGTELHAPRAVLRSV